QWETNTTRPLHCTADGYLSVFLRRMIRMGKCYGVWVEKHRGSILKSDAVLLCIGCGFGAHPTRTSWRSTSARLRQGSSSLEVYDRGERRRVEARAADQHAIHFGLRHERL